MRYLLTACLIGTLTCSVGAVGQQKDKAADKTKAAEDSKLVARTRKKLDEAITVDFKDTRLKDALEEIEKQTELIFRPDTKGGVSLNTNVTYSAKDKPLKDILEEIFKPRGLGYIIHRKQNATDRYEGYLDVVQGDQRGDEAAPKKEPAKSKPEKPAKADAKPDKPAKPADSKPSGASDDEKERFAASKLKQAKLLVEENQKADAQEYCEQIIKKYPDTKAAAEAKELLEKIKKK